MDAGLDEPLVTKLDGRRPGTYMRVVVVLGFVRVAVGVHVPRSSVTQPEIEIAGGWTRHISWARFTDIVSFLTLYLSNLLNATY